MKAFGGYGLGLRTDYYSAFCKGEVAVDFVEIISENFMVDGGRPLQVLDEVRAHYPVMMHGVSMSLGAVDGLDTNYLARLKALSDRVQPLWLSDHLCWTGIAGFNSHDLLPLPLSFEALDTVRRNINQAQDYLKRPLLLENPSTYLTFDEDDMPEWEFLTELCRRTGCYLLLDVNNICVSAHNHGFDALDYLNGIPLERVRQIHLAGHTRNGDLRIDTHDQPVPDEVWGLFAQVMADLAEVAVMIERDDNMPPLNTLLAELDLARSIGVAQSALVRA